MRYFSVLTVGLNVVEFIKKKKFLGMWKNTDLIKLNCNTLQNIKNTNFTHLMFKTQRQGATKTVWRGKGKEPWTFPPLCPFRSSILHDTWGNKSKLSRRATVGGGLFRPLPPCHPHLWRRLDRRVEPLTVSKQRTHEKGPPRNWTSPANEENPALRFKRNRKWAAARKCNMSLLNHRTGWDIIFCSIVEQKIFNAAFKSVSKTKKKGYYVIFKHKVKMFFIKRGKKDSNQVSALRRAAGLFSESSG